LIDYKKGLANVTRVAEKMTKILSEIAYDMTKEFYMINLKPNI